MNFLSMKLFTNELCALSLPLPLHHFWEAMYDDIQKAANDEPENAQCNREARLGTNEFF